MYLSHKRQRQRQQHLLAPQRAITKGSASMIRPTPPTFNEFLFTHPHPDQDPDQDPSPTSSHPLRNPRARFISRDPPHKMYILFSAPFSLSLSQKPSTMSVSSSSSSFASPPPPLLSDLQPPTGYNDSSSAPPHASSSINSSFLIILLILVVTFVTSISLCLLLRHLNRRCLRQVSSSSSTAPTVSDSHPLSNRRVSPEVSTPSVTDSLPLFTFSSITRRSSSTISADCAVCLSKFEPNDQLRLLPLCCHAFHAQCIDTWLESNQSCPLCRSAIFASESDLMKSFLASSNNAAIGSNSFRLEIGNVSRRRTEAEFGEPQRSYSIGSFDYLVDEASEVSLRDTHRRSLSDKEQSGALPEMTEASLASDVPAGRSWLKEYIDRLSFSLSSRAMSFRSSGRFFSGSSRRSDITSAADWDIEANRVGEEISELFRWLSGV